MSLSVEFFKPAKQAAAIVRNKPAVTREQFDALLPELRARAVTITGIEGASTVERIRDEISTLTRGQRDDGSPVVWADAKKEIAAVLEESTFSPEAAERRAELLLRTHANAAYESASYQQIMADPDTTHIQYITLEDDKVRPAHAALNGLVLPKDDPFWLTHFPPWDYGCRCTARGLNPDLLEEQSEFVPSPEELSSLRKGQYKGTDVRAPEQKDQDNPFIQSPGDLRVSLHNLHSQFDREDFGLFRSWSQSTQITPGLSVWDWLSRGGKSK